MSSNVESLRVLCKRPVANKIGMSFTKFAGSLAEAWPELYGDMRFGAFVFGDGIRIIEISHLTQRATAVLVNDNAAHRQHSRAAICRRLKASI